MADNKPKERSFLLTKDFLTSIVRTCEKEISIVEHQMLYYLSETVKNRYALTLLGELYSADCRLVKEFSYHLKHGMPENNKAGEECICFAQDQFHIIQSLIMARHFITSDILSNTNISICEN
tara:strand:+ start:157 stop:522 length:366 start_codon:yes stop_codon:yes gene_type:complete